MTAPAVRPGSFWLGTALGVAGSVTGGIGLRMAFERGHGRTAVPVRSALAAITVAAAAVTAAAVFGSSLTALVSTPHRYGQNWSRELDLGFGAVSQQVLATIVSAQPGVAGYAAGNSGQVSIGGRTVAAIGLTPVRGQGYLTLLAGHLPSGAGPDRSGRPDPSLAAPPGRPDSPGDRERLRRGAPQDAPDADRGRGGFRLARAAGRVHRHGFGQRCCGGAVAAVRPLPGRPVAWRRATTSSSSGTVRAPAPTLPGPG